MKVVVILCCGLCFSRLAAAQEDNGLRLLNNKERVDYAKTLQLPGPRVVIKDSTGAVLKNFNLKFPVVDHELCTAFDFYVNANGKITEIVVRKPRAADRELIKTLYDVEEERQRGSMELIKVDCKRERELMAEMLVSENSNHKNEQVINVELDNFQEATVMSILQQCAEPTLANVGTDGIRAVFLTLQHARRKYQDRYLPLLQSWIKNGNIRKGSLAAIEDRLLIASGLKQKYGTQIIFLARSGYLLYPIQDTEHIDKIRADVGLPTLEQYLKDREEFYGAEITQ